MYNLFSVRVHLLDNEHYRRAPRRDRHYPRHHLVDHPRLQWLAHALLPDRRQDVLYSAPRPRHTDPERVRGERRGDRRLAELELDAVQLAAWSCVPPEQPRRVSLRRPDESERRATADGLHAVVERRAVESERGWHRALRLDSSGRGGICHDDVGLESVLFDRRRTRTDLLARFVVDSK